MISLAPAAHAATHSPHTLHFCGSVTGPVSAGETAFCGQISMQRPQRTHRLGRKPGSGHAFQLSGLWHHRHRSGQPLKNTVVRIPCPSWMAYLLMSKIHPNGSDLASPHPTGALSGCRFVIFVTSKIPSDRNNWTPLEHTGPGPGTQAERGGPATGGSRVEGGTPVPVAPAGKLALFVQRPTGRRSPSLVPPGVAGELASFCTVAL